MNTKSSKITTVDVVLDPKKPRIVYSKLTPSQIRKEKPWFRSELCANAGPDHNEKCKHVVAGRACFYAPTQEELLPLPVCRFGSQKCNAFKKHGEKAQKMKAEDGGCPRRHLDNPLEVIAQEEKELEEQITRELEERSKTKTFRSSTGVKKGNPKTDPVPNKDGKVLPLPENTKWAGEKISGPVRERTRSDESDVMRMARKMAEERQKLIQAEAEVASSEILDLKKELRELKELLMTGPKLPFVSQTDMMKRQVERWSRHLDAIDLTRNYLHDLQKLGYTPAEMLDIPQSMYDSNTSDQERADMEVLMSFAERVRSTMLTPEAKEEEKKEISPIVTLLEAQVAPVTE